MTTQKPHHPSDETLHAFLDGEMPARALRRVEEHVAQCGRCSAEVDAWRTLFSELGDLASMRPLEGFDDRVMSGVSVPEPLPLAARIRDRVSAWIPGLGDPHLTPDRIHDLLEGFLPARQVASIRTHLDSCAACSTELRGWDRVYTSLDSLGRFEPGEGFSEAVLSAIEVLAPVPVAARAWSRLTGWSRRLVPQTRQAWAALSGIAVTPVVTVGLIFYAVFSHPTLTPGALVSYVGWQLADGASFVAAAIQTFAAGSAASLGLTPLLQTVIAAPLMWGFGFVVYSAACAFALRVLYTHLIASHPLDGRYARASLS